MKSARAADYWKFAESRERRPRRAVEQSGPLDSIGRMETAMPALSESRLSTNVGSSDATGGVLAMCTASIRYSESRWR